MPVDTDEETLKRVHAYLDNVTSTPEKRGPGRPPKAATCLERGVRRNSKLIAGDIQRHIDTIRTIAQYEHLSATCPERIAKAERVVPKMQATTSSSRAMYGVRSNSWSWHRRSPSLCIRVSFHRTTLTV
jgi:hypothetical protein